MGVNEGGINVCLGFNGVMRVNGGIGVNRSVGSYWCIG